MLVPNRISEQLTQATIDDVMGHIQAIHGALGFLVGLTPQDRVRMNTAGNASQAFIRKCADIAPHIDAFLPRGLDVAELRKDIDLMDALRPIMVPSRMK